MRRAAQYGRQLLLLLLSIQSHRLSYVILQRESTDSKVTCYSPAACRFRIDPPLLIHVKHVELGRFG